MLVEKQKKEKNSMIKNVIFDLDGTLLDTLEDLASSVNYALLSQGFPTISLERYAGLSATAQEI